VIRAITANKPSFHAVPLGPDFNLVLAEQSNDGANDEKDDPRKSTNGSGKTLLLLICHFCLGSDTVKHQLVIPELSGWEFTLTIEINGREYEVTRSVDNPARVRVEGDFTDWEIRPKRVEGADFDSFAVGDWTAALGKRLYELDPEDDSRGRPTFRGLFSYAVRRGQGSFVDPFRAFLGQSAASRDAANAHLLGINWRVFQKTHRLLGRREILKKASEGVDEAMRSGDLGDARELGDLEGRLLRVERSISLEADRMAEFRVHPRYREIQEEVSALTAAIRNRVGQAVSNRETLTFYQQAGEDEASVDIDEVRRLYTEAELEFPERVVRRLEEAEEFSRRLVQNRREYLNTEISRLAQDISKLDQEVQRMSSERDAALLSLEGKGALDDFLRIRQEHAEQSELRGALRSQIDQLRTLEENLAEVQIELEENKLAARESLDVSRDSWGRVVELFREFSGELFEKAGALTIDIGRNGKLKLDKKIERAGSQGVEEMMVFCYDLALAVAQAERGFGPRLLFHDSTIFDGVDRRQKGTAMRIAARESRAHEFQYLLCINEGDVPWDRVDADGVRQFVRRTLTDVGDGGLLGIRY
jgi:uncharacterized protein YydD (DUF2326 family)